MDSLTHLVIGGCIGQVIAGKTLGRKALLLGIIGQSIPDIDFVSGIWMTESEHILAHRGFTHSITFGVLTTLLLAWISKRVFHMYDLKLRMYIALFAINIMVHILLDTCNAYGTAFFKPFSDVRFSFHLLFVADPIFSIAPAIAFLWILFSRNNVLVKKRIAILGLCCCGIYISVALFNKTSINKQVTAQLSKEGNFKPQKIITPTLLNSLLWYIIVEDKEGFQVGYRSVFDTEENIHFKYFPQKDSLLKKTEDIEAAKDLIKFSGGFYTLDQWNDSLVLNVLRFGQVGWQDSSNRFAFYYYLNKPEANILTIQRGRFKSMDEQGWQSFLNRIKGR